MRRRDDGGHRGCTHRARPRPARGSRRASDRDAARSAELFRLSLYWLGLSSIFGAVMASSSGTGSSSPGWSPDGPVARRSLVLTIAARPDRHRRPADDRLDLRLHDLALGPAQAVHLHRLVLDVVFLVGHRDSEHRPARDRRIRRAAAVQLQLRAGPVPGLHPRSRAGAPGRAGERAGRDDAGARRRCRAYARVRGDRGDPANRVRARRRSRSASLELATMLLGRHPGARRDGRRRRGGRRWRAIASEAWGTDVLRERSFLWLVASRLAS